MDLHKKQTRSPVAIETRRIDLFARNPSLKGCRRRTADACPERFPLPRHPPSLIKSEGLGKCDNHKSDTSQKNESTQPRISLSQLLDVTGPHSAFYSSSNLEPDRSLDRRDNVFDRAEFPPGSCLNCSADWEPESRIALLAAALISPLIPAGPSPPQSVKPTLSDPCLPGTRQASLDCGSLFSLLGQPSFFILQLRRTEDPRADPAGLERNRSSTDIDLGSRALVALWLLFTLLLSHRLDSLFDHVALRRGGGRKKGHQVISRPADRWLRRDAAAGETCK